MTSYASAAASLTNALHLSWPPIAVCLAASVPDGIPHYTRSKATCRLCLLAGSVQESFHHFSQRPQSLRYRDAHAQS